MNFEYHNPEKNPKKLTETRRSFLRKFGSTLLSAAGAGALIEKGLEISEEGKKNDESPEIPRPHPETSKTPESPEQSELDKEYERVLTRLLQEIPKADSEVTPRTERETFDYKEKCKFPFLYSNKAEEPVTTDVDLLGDINRFGMLNSFSGRIVQTMRFQILTMAVERRYNLPHNIILAMILQESGGEEFLPNSLGDGGFGLCHMQPATSREYGLKVFKDCNAIVCNGEDDRSCLDPNNPGIRLNHAKELKEKVEKYKDDRGLLSGTDDRLNHLNNLDAVGRMLSFHIQKYPESKRGLESSWGPLRTAVGRYSGPANSKKYVENIFQTMSLLDDANFLEVLYKKFNNANSGNKINGRSLDIGSYVSEWEKFFMVNYGVADYINQPCYTTPVSNDILKTYKNFLPQINDPYRQASL